MRKLLSLMLIAAVSIISSTAQIVKSTSITHTFQRVEEPPKPPKPWNHSGMFIGGNWAYFPPYQFNGLELPGASTYGLELGYRLLLVDTKIGGFSWNIIKFQFSSDFDDAALINFTTGVRYDSPRIRGGISLYGSFDFGAGTFFRSSIGDDEGRTLEMTGQDEYSKSTEIAVGVKLSRHFSIGVSVRLRAAGLCYSYIHHWYSYNYYNGKRVYTEHWDKETTHKSATLSVPTVKFEYLF